MESGRIDIRRNVALTLGLLVASTGTVVFVAGWLLDIAAVRSVFPHLVTMKANTSICFALSGIALVILLPGPESTSRRTLAAALALVVTILGILTLSQYFFALDFGIDQFLVRDTDVPIGTATRGRMSPTTAYCLALAGFALFLCTLPKRLNLRTVAVTAFACALVVLGSLSLIGYLSETLLHLRVWNYSGMAVHSAMAFIALGAGLFAFAMVQEPVQWTMALPATSGFVAAVVVMFTAAGVAYDSLSRLVDATERVTHSQDVLGALDLIGSSFADLESSQRGYIILGDERLLKSRVATKEDLHQALDDCAHLLADMLDEAARCARLRSLANERIDVDEKAIALRRTDGFEAAQALIASRAGIAQTERIDGMVRRMHDAESTRLAARIDASRNAATRTFLLLPFGTFVSLTLMALGLFFVNAGTHQRRRAEQSLRESEDLFERAFRLSPDCVAIVRESDRSLVTANETLCGLWNCRPEDVIGKPARDFALWIDDEDRQRFLKRLQEDGECLDHEASMRLLDGRELLFSISARLIMLKGESCILSMMRDVTERRRIDEMQQRLAMIVNSSDDAIVSKTTDGIVTSWNRGAEKMFGYRAPEAIGRPMLFLFPPGREDEEEHLLARIRAGESIRHFETVRLRRDGKPIDVSVTLSPIRNADGRIVGASKITRDITERKRAEAALRASEERYRSTLESILEGCQILDFDWNYLYVNDAALSQGGRGRDELIGRRFTDVWPGVDRNPVHRLIARGLDERAASRDEIRLFFPDGRSGWFDVHTEPVPEGIFILSIDITERKRAERSLRELNESLERRVIERTDELRLALIAAEEADRVKSSFLATMSHELRTPLNSILGFTGLVLQGLAGPLNPEQTKQLSMVQGSARHLLDLINDVLDISKIEAGQMEVDFEGFDLAAAVEQVRGLIAPMAKAKGLDLHVELPPALPTMVSDRRRIVQILINLANNAVKFTPSGSVTLRLALAPGASGVKRARIVVEVTDTGVGIRPEDLTRMFEPFRQLDSGLSRQHEGTGLGLAICRRLAILLGGDVQARSEWGAGSVFTVTLPLAPGG